jgi:hypothetical protein
VKDWREVKDEIEADIDRIWWDEPEEVTLSKLGVFPSGASVDGQVIAKMLGNEAPPGCPAPWLNLPKLYKFCVEIEESFPSVETKEELGDLLWSWFNYVNCLNRWFFLVFPWHLGKMFPLVKPEDVEELARLHNLEVKRRD